MSAELEQARRVAVTLEQQVALLTEFAQDLAYIHEGRGDGYCRRCEHAWPCPERVQADRVLLAVSAVEASS